MSYPELLRYYAGLVAFMKTCGDSRRAAMAEGRLLGFSGSEIRQIVRRAWSQPA
jgi:hypothetical protein